MRLRGRLTRHVPEAMVVLLTAARVEMLMRRHDLPDVCRQLGLTLDLEDVTQPGGTMPMLPAWTRSPVRWTDRIIGRWPFGDTCLRRCLVLGHRLSGLGPVLRMGTRRGTTAPVLAHAWLEVDGRPLDADLEGIDPLVGPWAST